VAGSSETLRGVTSENTVTFTIFLFRIDDIVGFPSKVREEH
jgi:hypothetical protein